MLFNSLEFALFLPIVFFIYWVVLKDYLKAQNFFILIASYIFYGWWDWRFLSLIVLSSLLDFHVGRLLHTSQSAGKRKLLLGLSLFINLGLLAFFKYFNFFISNFSNAFTIFGMHPNIVTLKIILPVGISFYTFQTLSYTIDIYRKKISPTNDIIAFFSFVSFFPQLVAGPIERASHLLPQFLKKRAFDYQKAKLGSKQILYGLFKKIVVADTLSVYVDVVYSNTQIHSGGTLAIATFFFAFQIYCDFSGYSDLAIGISKLFGFDLMTNFKRPYFSASIQEFWSRWHISLSTWFRDYVYIPLGGSRSSELSTHKNLFITFTVSGLWHGANWTYIIWGFLHSIFNSAERIVSRKFAPIPTLSTIFIKPLKILIIFSLVSLTWVFFRAATVSDALFILKKIFLFEFSISVLDPIVFSNSLLAILILLILDLFIEMKLIHKLLPSNLVFRYSAYALFVAFIILQGNFNNNQFIYFQF